MGFRGGGGDRDAEFTAFARQAQDPLLRTAWLLTGDGQAAAELVQAALVKTYVAWPKVRQGTALAYTRRVMANHHVDAWRSTRREVLADEVPEGPVGPAPSGASYDDRDEIRRWLATLPEAQRRVVVLRHWCDLSEKETAETLGISLGAVKSLGSRGLAALRQVAEHPARPTEGAQR
ncbi:SigE family RNA polymerase sigma factor [Lapillicoccus jejuensis]|uniref:RNA polymerase sigma-70 factor (Sigma-E family) n=1 Tax=Lapillicoccus jejuensis TaxID=402171 RepID=A0A542DW76_9MICO|nr:SigE family RNA polymerase sigma factor [Lapillicoccus jejuensis]TQJ07343.1 RNA polymerase sigma-70 factor (sigma-E family) [Lapillicoccus jejuensis]